MGTEAEFWRSRIVDPTGTFFVTAGRYQPEAAQVLARTTPPEFVAVIGKPSTYATKEGNLLTSIRAESIQVVDATTRDRWVADAVKAREHYSANIEAHYPRAKTPSRSHHIIIIRQRAVSIHHRALGNTILYRALIMF